MPFNVCPDSACSRINAFVNKQEIPLSKIDFTIINPEKKKKAVKKSVKPRFDSFESALRGALADGEISKKEKLSSKQKFDKVFDQTLEENPSIMKTLINLSVLAPIAGLAQRLGFDGILQNFIDADGAGKTSWLRKQLDFFVSHNGGYDNVPRIASDYQSHRASGKTLSEFLLDKEGAYGSSYLPGVRPLIGASSPPINIFIQPMADIFSGNLSTSFDQ